MSDILARLQTADCSCLFKPCTDAKPEIISASNDATVTIKIFQNFVTINVNVSLLFLVWPARHI